LFLQVFDTSDLPGGVVNIVTGDRDHLAKYLAEHQDVQSIWCHGGNAATSQFVEYASADNVKRTWVDYGLGAERDWADSIQGSGEEFLYHSTQVKNVWIPMGDIFAN
jgi:aldehyde dehydrogenase (NAD+)